MTSSDFLPRWSGPNVGLLSVVLLTAQAKGASNSRPVALHRVVHTIGLTD